MRTQLVPVWLVPVVVLAAVAASPVWGIPTPEQRREVAALQTSLRLAGNLHTQGKIRESAEVVKEVQTRLASFDKGADKDLNNLLAPVYSALEKTHALLELEGLKLPPLTKPEPAMSAPTLGTPATPGTPVTLPAGAASFVKDVAPILVSKCGTCHVNRMQGSVSMATYAALMKGPPEGVIIFPGKADGSRIIEVIESGDMPRGGLRMTATEKAVLKKWIDEGAKSDAPADTTPLTQLASNVQPAAPPRVDVTPPTGSETVSFAKDIAPVLAANCMGCHGAMQPRANLSLATFERLLRGGDGGPPVQPGKPAESLLIGKLKGTAGGARMPQGRPPLPAATIATVEKWIAEGSKFDGTSQTQDVALLAAITKARLSTHEELTAERARLAEGNWRLALPRVTFSKTETKNFFVYGTMGQKQVDEIAQKAEDFAAKVATIYRAPADAPLVKGRMAIFLFDQRYDYSEFGSMVEKRDPPKNVFGHWQYTVLDAYGCALRPKQDEYSLDALLVEQLAGTHVASLGSNVPRWFAAGCGRVAASRLAATDPRVQSWDKDTSRVVGMLGRPDDFLQGRMAPEDSDIASFGLVTYLMKDSRRFNQVMDALRKGDDFNPAFTSAYGGTPAQAVQAWVARGGK
jgi:cytochrome c553/mono/diheme cytochrome c family protein